MGRIWKLNGSQDEQLPKEISDEMKSLGWDLDMLSELSFPRQALDK